MEKKKMTQVVILLLLISVIIYALQIFIFHDPQTTAFYIFQDFAFMPATIAIATLVVGKLMDEQEKKEKVEKTKMLTSTFFTGIGTAITTELLEIAEPKEHLANIIALRCTDANLKQKQDNIRQMEIKINLTKEVYESVMQKFETAQTSLLVLSSNPMLFEHEDFTDLLWAIFHLIDEYHLRDDFNTLDDHVLHHLNKDFEQMLRLLLINYIANAKYLRETYPHFYESAKEKISSSLID